jgi:hypothetical protein
MTAGAWAQTTRPASSSPPSQPPASQNAVSREEYDKLNQSQDELRREVQALREQLQRERAAPPPAGQAPATAPAPPAAGTAAPATQPSEAVTSEDFDEMDKQIKSLRQEVDRNRFGTSQFHLAGDAAVGFTARKGEKSTFDAGVAPLILWKPEKNILIEAGFDIAGTTNENNESSTEFALTLANISFLVNDNLFVGGGLFVVPFGQYHRHFDPPWINKFPDDPLPFGDGGIAPAEETGFFLGGAVPVADTKVTYDLYVTNGPNLLTGADSTGQLNFDDFTDLNNGKAVGGRIGFLPFYNIEVGYSAMFAQVNGPGFPDTNAVLQAADLNWRQDVKRLSGQLDFRTEWVFSHVDRATYDPTSAAGFGPITFNNDRNGGYVQLCYRPTMADEKYLRKVELVSRYDMLRSSLNAPGGDHEDRLTLGVDYWVTPAIVLKTAYQFDNKEIGDNQNALLFQIGIGL